MKRANKKLKVSSESERGLHKMNTRSQLVLRTKVNMSKVKDNCNGSEINTQNTGSIELKVKNLNKQLISHCQKSQNNHLCLSFFFIIIL